MLIKNGTHVLIKSSFKYDMSGLAGIVSGDVYESYDSIPVRVPGRENPRSAKGVFWYPLDCLEIIGKESIEEEKFMLPGYEIAYVHFIDDECPERVYPYALYNDGYPYSGNTKVAVKTGHHGFAIAEIVRVEGYQPGLVKHGREVVCPLIFQAYEDRQNKAKEIKKLEMQMKAKADELQNVALYQILAEKSPEMKEMLDRYTELTK